MGGANLEWVEQMWAADILEKTLLCKFLFSWPNFLKLDTYLCDWLWDKGHICAYFQNHLRLPVAVQILHSMIEVGKRVDQVALDFLA